MMKVAMLSYWHVHAPDYTRQVQNNPNAEIVAVWDEEVERGQKQAAELNVPFYSSLDELLTNPDIDAVVVDAPTNLHCEVMVKAAQAKKHIFTEKVLAPTLKEANEIVRAVRDNQVKLTVSLRRMYEHYTAPIEQVLKDGLLGQVTFIRIRDAHNGASANWLPERFYNKQQTFGGALVDLGCHPMYLSRHLLGLPESVSTSFGYVTGKAVEDNAVSVLRYQNGALAVVETGFVSSFSPFSVEICGTEGTLLLGHPEESILVRTAKPGHPASSEWQTLPRQDARPSALDQWVSHIQNGSDDPVNTEVAIDLTRLMEASNLSASQNRAVSLSELQG